MDNTSIARALFSALAANDEILTRTLCRPDLKVSQNGGPTMNLDMLLEFNAKVHLVVAGLEYCEAICSATASGFVEEHLLRGVLPDGQQLALPLCVVADVNGGKVTRAREYFDTGSASALISALRRAAGKKPPV